MTDIDLERAGLLFGDCRERLRGLPENSLDACVTDPPYELGFMGKAWDASGIAYSVDLWREVLRVLKPGGHLLAFGATRTYHRMACAIEDAGFEVRDSLHWIYGTGFPKSKTENSGMPKGCGTALKPAHEPIVMARKPLIGTVAANLDAFGTGAINVDACRVATDEDRHDVRGGSKGKGGVFSDSGVYNFSPSPAGRWPANVLFDEGAAAELGEAARFFYVAKPSRAERDLGCAHLPPKAGGEATDRQEDSAGVQNPRAGANRGGGARNFHPTVKPIELMRYLVRLVTPPGGAVVDPFAGSGTTGIATLLEGFKFLGIEASPEYFEILKARVLHAHG